MELARLHRRLSALMALCALAALVDGAGVATPAVAAACVGLVAACFWQPGPGLGRHLDRVWLVAALLLAGRAVASILAGDSGGVVPWVDLLLVLLLAEALKPLGAQNDGRLYGLAFALLVASTAYRPSLAFALAFAGFVAFSAVALMVGYLRRQAESFAVPELRVGRRVILATFALSSVVLATSAGVFVFFPRVAQGWMVREAGARRAVAGFGGEVSLAEHGATIASNPEVVLRVEFDGGAAPRGVEAMHWRGRSFDHFDGVRWSSSPDLPPASPWPDSYATRWPGPIVAYEVFSTPLREKVLFGLHPLLDLRPRTLFEPYLTEAGDVLYHGEDAPVYRAVSKAGPPPADALRRAPDRDGPADRHYLQLPRLPRRVHALADSLTRGADTRYDKAVAVERWLRGELDYTRELPGSELDASLDAFLFERRAGHCEYFSTAMAVLLRSAGIPARNVTGFLGGDWNEFGRYIAVTQDRAHSWVEVWFAGYGWVAFDPTPAGSGGAAGAASALGGARLLLDGLQHRWQKWVVDYDLQKQVLLMRRAARLFEGDGGAAAGAGAALPWRRALAAALALAALAALLRLAVRWRARARLGDPARLYLALRRRYRSAGLEPDAAAPPLAFAEALHAAGAPGADAAGRLVRRYLAARFGGAGGGEVVVEMRALLREATRALRSPAEPRPRR